MPFLEVLMCILFKEKLIYIKQLIFRRKNWEKLLETIFLKKGEPEDEPSITTVAHPMVISKEQAHLNIISSIITSFFLYIIYWFNQNLQYQV